VDPIRLQIHRQNEKSVGTNVKMSTEIVCVCVCVKKIMVQLSLYYVVGVVRSYAKEEKEE
jgi:hypothetical protein